MECVTGEPKMEREKEHRQTANVISGKDKQWLLKSATGQLPLETLLSLPAECKPLNSSVFVPLMSKESDFYCINLACVKTLSGYVCFLATSHREGAAALYISINECLHIIPLVTVQ